jgi:hypothetical protein
MTSSSGNSGTHATMGRLEYVVESRHNGDVETWFVLRPYRELARHYEALGVELSATVASPGSGLAAPGGRSTKTCPAPSPAGFNPYFDLPPV